MIPAALRRLGRALRRLFPPRPAVALLEEYERLADALAIERDLQRRVAILARLGPVARELHRRGVT